MILIKKYKQIQYLIVALMVSATIISCKKDKIETVSGVDVVNLPSEKAINLKVLYTENGVLKNEFSAKEVEQFFQADTPYYYFPKGIYACSYTDSIATPNADIVAEEAVLRESPRFFEAYRNVVARNIKLNQTLQTDTMYWDPSKKDKAVYSYSSSLIIRPPDTIPAVRGFNADQEFKNYELIKVPRAVLYVAMNPDSTNNVQNDSIKIAEPRHEP